MRGQRGSRTGEPSAALEKYVAEDRPAAGLPLDEDMPDVLAEHTTAY